MVVGLFFLLVVIFLGVIYAILKITEATTSVNSEIAVVSAEIGQLNDRIADLEAASKHTTRDVIVG